MEKRFSTHLQKLANPDKEGLTCIEDKISGQSYSVKFAKKLDGVIN